MEILLALILLGVIWLCWAAYVIVRSLRVVGCGIAKLLDREPSQF